MEGGGSVTVYNLQAVKQATEATKRIGQQQQQQRSSLRSRNSSWISRQNLMEKIFHTSNLIYKFYAKELEFRRNEIVQETMFDSLRTNSVDTIQNGSG